jgi:hypothetical protein
MFHLLSDAESNEKLAKSMGRGFLVAGLSLRPANLSGYEVCPWRTSSCTQACVLEHAGRGNMANVQDARDRKTRLFFEDRPEFLRQLHKDLSKLESAADRQDLIPVCRLNVASDLPWERIDPALFSAHPAIRFYDYTKGIKRLFGTLPANYELLYSYNEHSDPADVVRVLDAGHNVAIVFDTLYNPAHGKVDPLPTSGRIPGTTRRFSVVDGDQHDLRLRDIDGAGVIVGLRGKGGRKIVLAGVSGGFIVPTIGGVSTR